MLLEVGENDKEKGGLLHLKMGLAALVHIENEREIPEDEEDVGERFVAISVASLDT